MELTERFFVPAGVDQVWQLFDDVPEVVKCMPGAEVTEQVDEQTYNARLTIAVGPIRPRFDVKATIERDPSAHQGRIHVHAVDKRGGSQARGQIVYRLTPGGDGTAVELVQNVTLSGPLAQFGRSGMIEDINAQMTRDFANCLAANLSLTTAGDEPADRSTAPVSNSTDEPVATAPPASSNEIRIIPLVARTVYRRILTALRRRR